jgi:hypothetical protein
MPMREMPPAKDLFAGRAGDSKGQAPRAGGRGSADVEKANATWQKIIDETIVRRDGGGPPDRPPDKPNVRRCMAVGCKRDAVAPEGFVPWLCEVHERGGRNARQRPPEGLGAVFVIGQDEANQCEVTETEVGQSLRFVIKAADLASRERAEAEYLEQYPSRWWGTSIVERRKPPEPWSVYGWRWKSPNYTVCDLDITHDTASHCRAAAASPAAGERAEDG